MSKKLKVTTICIPVDLLNDIEKAMERHRYATLSEVVREALREWLRKRKEACEQAEAKEEA